MSYSHKSIETWHGILASLEESRQANALSLVNRILKLREAYDAALLDLDEYIAPGATHPLWDIVTAEDGDFEAVVSVLLIPGGVKFETFAALVEAIGEVVVE